MAKTTNRSLNRNLLQMALMCSAILLSSAASSLGAVQPPYFSPEAKEARRLSAVPQDREYLVDVGSRVILPQRGAQVVFRQGFAEVYVQFERPLRSAERGQVTRLGVKIHSAVAAHTYLARVRQQALQGLRNHPLLRGIEPVEPVDKLTAALFTRDLHANAVNSDGTVSVYVRFYEDVQLAQALEVLDRVGAAAEQRDRLLFNQRLLARIRPEQLLELAASERVRGLSEIPAPPADNNLQSAQASNVDVVQAAPFNLDGAGVVLGMWESGNPQADHPDLTPRIVAIEGSETQHGTHVAGTILGSGVNFPAALGMAPAAGNLFSYTSAGNVADEQSDAVADNGIVISNHSWGQRCGYEPDIDSDFGTACFGQYDGTAADWDTLVRDTGLIIAKAAGNDSNDCDGTTCDGVTGSDGLQYHTIGTTGNAKNILTIGAIGDDGVTVTNFSSRGPTDDFRIKPDVVADGANLTSTCPTSTTCVLGGTSMSTPTVSGISALLVQRYRQYFEGATPSPDIVKALLVNTAVDLGRPGPDYLYGHGLVDALAAVNTIDVGAVRILTDSADTGDVNEYLLEARSGATELRVTLAWIDPEGPTGSGPVLINDLDLRVINPQGTIFFPFSGPTATFTDNASATGPNTVDNVEHLRVVNPAQGFYRVQVRGTSVPDGPQNYALVADASFDLPDQPNIRVNANLDFDEICEDEFQDKVVTIFNIGGGDLVVHSASVVAGGTEFSVLPSPTQPFIVKPGAHVDVTVRFSPTSPGLKNGTLRIVSNDADEGTLDFPMTGEGGAPVIDTIVPDQGHFGDVCVGTFQDLELTIVNSGTCDLVVYGINNSNPGAFELAGVMSWPVTISPGNSLQIPIRFRPSVPGDFEAQLTVISDDPVTPDKTVTFSGSAPGSEVSVSEDLAFPATVIQSVGSCTSSRPFIVANTGACPVYIQEISISANAEEYGFSGMPGLPLLLLPGEQVGEGNLNAIFAPQSLARHVFGSAAVTYLDNPLAATTTTVDRSFCGEGVRTGARVLVTQNGVPLNVVDRIKLQRINANRNAGKGGNVDTLDNSRDLELVTIAEAAPCPGIPYHREYGTVSNPIQLLPGSYEIVVQTRINGKQTSKTVAFDVGTCDFNPNIVVDF